MFKIKTDKNRLVKEIYNKILSIKRNDINNIVKIDFNINDLFSNTCAFFKVEYDDIAKDDSICSDKICKLYLIKDPLDDECKEYNLVNCFIVEHGYYEFLETFIDALYEKMSEMDEDDLELSIIFTNKIDSYIKVANTLEEFNIIKKESDESLYNILYNLIYNEFFRYVEIEYSVNVIDEKVIASITLEKLNILNKKYIAIDIITNLEVIQNHDNIELIDISIDYDEEDECIEIITDTIRSFRDSILEILDKISSDIPSIKVLIDRKQLK